MPVPSVVRFSVMEPKSNLLALLAEGSASVKVDSFLYFKKGIPKVAPQNNLSFLLPASAIASSVMPPLLIISCCCSKPPVDNKGVASDLNVLLPAFHPLAVSIQ
jgi:hypothetical protein